jgi:anti-sigma factor RsiW
MPKCKEIEPLFAAYVDDEAAPADRTVVSAHLQACPPCRDRVASERAARDVLRARGVGLRPCASEALRTRCAAHRPAAVSGGLLGRRTWMPLSAAAVLVLAAAGVFIFGVGEGVEAFATQLAADHIACFQFPPDRTVEAAVLERNWSSAQGWPLRVPPSSGDQQLELLGARRCRSSAGRVAHVMYRWRGQPLSMFVLNSRVDAAPEAASQFDSIDKLGAQTVIWSKRGRTYALVARAPTPDLLHVAGYIRQIAE